MKRLAVFFAILTLLLSMRPSFAMAGSNTVSTCCQDDACSGTANDEDKDSSDGAGEESGPCNPFQCHTCCFLYFPTFPVFAWLQEPVVLIHSTVPQNRIYSLYPPSFWQPPKIV